MYPGRDCIRGDSFRNRLRRFVMHFAGRVRPAGLGMDGLRQRAVKAAWACALRG